MEAPFDAQSATSGGARIGDPSDLGDFFHQLDLEGEDFDELEIDVDDLVLNNSVRWLALARVHTKNSFNQAAFFKEMCLAWNPTHEVRFRPVGPNLFVVQASCLGDWERIMERGPCIFRYWVVLSSPYDGFNKVEEIEIVHMPIWLQIHKLTDVYCKKELVEKLVKNAGNVLYIRLNGNSRGDYIQVHVRHDVREPLKNFVSIICGKERQVFVVRYEKIGNLCG